MDKIGGREFKEVIRHGIENLVKDRTLLNKINVYPVPDGDTGDNLANTLKPILGLLEEVEEETETTLNFLEQRFHISLERVFTNLPFASREVEALPANLWEGSL